MSDNANRTHTHRHADTSADTGKLHRQHTHTHPVGSAMGRLERNQEGGAMPLSIGWSRMQKRDAGEEPSPWVGRSMLRRPQGPSERGWAVDPCAVAFSVHSGWKPSCVQSLNSHSELQSTPCLWCIRVPHTWTVFPPLAHTSISSQFA